MVCGIKDRFKFIFVVYNKVPVLERGHQSGRFVQWSAVVVYMSLIYTTLFDKFHDLIKNIHGIFGFGPMPAPLIATTLSCHRGISSAAIKNSSGTVSVGDMKEMHY